MKLLICSFLVIGLVSQSFSLKYGDKKEEKNVQPVSDVDRKTDKRGVVEIQASNSAYITPAPSIQVSHGPTVLPAVSVTPGIVYAPQKQIVATASPSQLYAKPSPNLSKVSDAVVAPGHISSALVANQLYQQQHVYQPLTKVAYNAPNFAVSAPIAANLAYSKHQIFPQQVYHQQQALVQPQVHYSAYSQPQAVYAQPQINYAHSQLNYAQPQLSLVHAQPQVLHAQPQVQIYQQQPVAYHHQPQVAVAHAYNPLVTQPVAKVAYAQPQVVAQQVYQAQPVALKGESAVSYASFAQSQPGAAQYSTPLTKVSSVQAPVIAKQVYQPQYYQQQQHYQQISVPQVYAHQPQVVAHQQVYAHQPQILTHQPQILTHQPQILTHQPQILTHQPQILSHQPQIYSHQPQILAHQPQILVQQQPQYYQNQQQLQYTANKVAYSQPTNSYSSQYFNKITQNPYSGYNNQ